MEKRENNPRLEWPNVMSEDEIPVHVVLTVIYSQEC